MSEPTGASNGFDGLGVQVRYLGKDRGYAGVASRAIAAGDVLVRVPRSKMLTAADARACPSVGAAARELSDHRALVLKLLHEKAKFDEAQALRRETRGDENDGLQETPGTSAFAPWLETLPDFTTLEEAHPLLWRRERREACLKGAPTLWRVESAKARSAADKIAIISALAANEGETATLPSVRHLTIEDVLWATAIVSSRAFYLENVDAVDESDESDESNETDDKNSGDFRDGGDDAEFETVFACGSDDFDDDDDDWSYDDDDEDVFEAFGGAPEQKRGDDKGEEERDVFDETMDDGDDFGLAKNKSVSALALVPWADALNHSPRASAVASLRFDARTNVAELRASRAYEKNEEVFDTYGVAKTPAETFLAYGFAAFPPDVSSSSSEDAAAAAADDDDEEEETSSFADDACVIPGSWFWAESEKAELERNAADASNALSLLAREEAAAGASHRSVVLGYLVAAGAAPEDVDITLRVKSGGDRNKGKTSSKSLAPVGDAALRWCAAATATRAELFEAGWRGPFSTDPAAAATEAQKKRALSRAEAARVVHALGSNQAARARARTALARLVARLLENYPSFAKEPSLAGGVGRAPSAGADAEPGIGIGIGVGVPPDSTAEAHDGRVATGDAAAALVLASEARAMRAALEALVGWT